MTFGMFKKVKHDEVYVDYKNGLRLANKLKGSYVLTDLGECRVGSITPCKSRVALYQEDGDIRHMLLIHDFYRLVTKDIKKLH